jgi:hypothetical protein
MLEGGTHACQRQNDPVGIMQSFFAISRLIGDTQLTRVINLVQGKNGAQCTRTPVS